MSNDNERKYKVTLENDNTLKQLFDRFYIIPKDINELNLDNKTKFILENASLGSEKFKSLKVREGKNGYIVFRKSYKKFNQEQQEQIKREVGLSQRKLAKKYNCSVATINKILKDKY